MNRIRTMLFIPGNNPGMLVSADNLEADAIIYDLEDAVSISEKDAARDLVENAIKTLKYKNSQVTVRINPSDGKFWKDDLDMIIRTKPDGVVLPKASMESMKIYINYLNKNYKKEEFDKIKLYLLVESCVGVIDIEEVLKKFDNINGILLGGEDYSSDLGTQRSANSIELLYARIKLANAASAFNINCIDTPYTDIDNIEGLIRDTEFIKSIGFNGKLVVGPRQVPDINGVFAPTDEEIENAQAILSLNERKEKEGVGVFSFKGKMVDKPVIDRARNLVNSAKDWGII